MLSISAKASSDFKVNGLYYDIVSIDNLTCACVENPDGKYSGKIVIPSSVSYNGKTLSVVEVAEYAFFQSDITSVEIGGNVKTLGKYSFDMCRSLYSVKLENGVETIGQEAFANCPNLQFVSLPESIKEIKYGAFNGCRQLTGVIAIPGNCSVIGAEAFSGNPNMLLIKEGEGKLTVYDAGLGRNGGDFIRISRDISPKSQFIGLYEFKEIIFDDNVTYMPECFRAIHDEGVIDCLTIGKSISEVPRIAMFDVKKIVLNSSVPPKATEFLNKTYMNAILCVPKGSISAYKEANVWKNFWNIEEF